MRRPTALAADAPRFATRSPARQDHATRIKNAPVDLIRGAQLGAMAGDGYAQPRECPASKACTGPDHGSSRKPLMAEGRSLPQVRDPSPSEVSGDGAARGLMAGPDARPDLRPDLLGGPWRRGSSFGGRGGVGAPSTEGRARRRANPNPGHTLSAGAARVGSLKHRRPSFSPAARSPAASAGRQRGAGLSTSAILHPSGISIHLLSEESHRLGERPGRRGRIGWPRSRFRPRGPTMQLVAARREATRRTTSSKAGPRTSVVAPGSGRRFPRRWASARASRVAGAAQPEARGVPRGDRFLSVPRARTPHIGTRPICSAWNSTKSASVMSSPKISMSAVSPVRAFSMSARRITPASSASKSRS